ncbi:TetR/AcrR family transcriptional regulator [Sphingopyxis yananensis]|uniref:TetR/AcrR family transcriptional regulator n=1 Tax=Sphingopyxis yananensis TaxID=2886687 RepID=UPI001D123C9D|nr:TetR/AcrR family transcriptional regulator [Sphingopyxis yananensis]MCC2600851.1 TetR/AcrR family transcriptional regulator [Sphingopyxis yananensis]
MTIDRDIADDQRRSQLPATPAPKKRVQDRGLATKQRILDEALQQFSRSGFDAVGVRDIAEAAGVQHGLIKYHFGTKDNLWREAVRQLFQRATQILQVPPEEENLSTEEATEKALRRYVRYCADHPEHARLMVQESFRDNERLEWASRKFIRPSHDDILPRWQDLIGKGVAPNIDPVLMLYAMTGAAQTLFSIAAEAKHSHGIDALSEEVIQQYSDVIVTLFMPGLMSAHI